MAQPVDSSNRFNRPSNTCPICSGWERSNPQCKGYLGDKPGAVFCTNSDYAGMLPRGNTGVYRHWTGRSGCKCGVNHLDTNYTPKSSGQEKTKENRRLDQTFDYGDGCYVDRFDLGYMKNGKPAKDHIQYQIIDGKKVYKGFKKLYRVKEFLESDRPKLWGEGERKVDKLWEMGFAATCNVGGSGGWVDEYADQLVKAKGPLFIWPDNDTPGFKLAGLVSESLNKRNYKNFILNRLTVGLPDNGGDVLDWVKIPGNDPLKLQAELDMYTSSQFFEIFDFSDLGKLPKPEWLIEPLLIKNYLACLFGSTQTAKSLWALHQALTLADQGVKVLYLAGENSNGYYTRMLAWYKHFNKLPNSNFKLIRTPVAFLEPEQVGKLIATINHHFPDDKPALIVDDTLSKSYLGGDENDAKDMRNFIASCELLRTTFAASVLVIHHAPKSGATPRGSSVIEGDFDTLIHAVKDEKAGAEKKVIYTCLKQKDAKEFDQLTYKIITPSDGYDLEEGAVLELSTDAVQNTMNYKAANKRNPLGPAQQKLLAVIAMTIYEQGIGSTEFGFAAGYDMKVPSKKTSFYDDLNVLLDKEYVAKTGSARSTKYFITPAGRDLISSSDLGL